MRRTAVLLLLSLITLASAFGLGWPDGPTKTIYYTPGASIGVVYIATDTIYELDASVEIVSGSLPTGISWANYGSCSGGKLCTAYFGTPSGTATTTQVLRAHSGGATADITVVFQPNYAFGGTLTASGVVGLAYSSGLTLSGGTAPNTISLSSGTLPPGLSLNTTTGAISGTPTTAGTYTFTLGAVDSESRTATSGSKTITIYAALAVTTSSLAATTVGATYSQTLASSGGTTPKTWSVASGSLPTGLSLNASTGAITGTPSVAGTASFTAQVACCSGATGTSSSLSIVVNPAPSISTTTLPGGAQGAAYSQTLSATGGTGTLAWTVSAGALPAGLTLSSGGVLSGTPSASGTFNFTVRATDTVSIYGSQALSLTLVNTPTITTASLPALTVGQAVSSSLAASGGTSPYTWNLTAGVLPTGLAINNSTGAFYGTASAAGAFNFTAQVTDSNSQTGSAPLSWTVNAAPAISTTSLAATTAGASYSAAPSASGGTGSLTWSVSTGALPAGLSLNTSTGAITGTSTTAGTANFTLQVADTNSVTASQPLSIVVNAAPAIPMSSLADATISLAYSETLPVTGGTAPLTWSVTSGALPAGLSLSGAGVVSGTPTTAGTFNFTARVQDALSIAATQGFTILVVNPPSISTSSLAAITVGQNVSTTLAVTNGRAPYTWSVAAGALPAGLALNASSGALTGTPSAAGAASFTARVTDADNLQANAALNWTVNAAPSITTTTIAATTLTRPLASTTLAATGGTGALTWSATGLPAGLALSTAGVLSGTPTAAATTQATFKVTDSNNVESSTPLTITVNPEPAVTTASLPLAVEGSPYSQTLTASGGTGAISWTLSAGSLPAGLALSSSGLLSGTTTALGSASFTVQAQDSLGVNATRALTLLAANAPVVTTSRLAEITVSQPVQVTLQATKGTQPYQWSVTSGSLPAGLALNASTGVVRGAATTATPAAFTLQVSDANSLTASRSFTWQVNAALSIKLPQSPALITGKAAGLPMARSGGTLPISFSYQGLPPGLVGDPNSGDVSGTPTAAGSYTITVSATDANGVNASSSASWTVVAGVAIPGGSLAPLTALQTASRPIATSGGTRPFTWFIAAGAVPTGMILGSADGVVSGRPTVEGDFAFTAQVTDANGVQASQSFSLTVYRQPAITTSSLPNVNTGQSLDVAFEATGGAPPLRFSLGSGSLPAGLTLSSSGTLSGIATTSGAFSFSVQVADANSATSQRNFSLTVAEPRTLRLSPAALSFAAVSGGAAPAPQQVAVTSSPSQQSVRVASSAAWLSASLSGATTPVVLEASVNHQGLKPGIHTARITVDGPESRTVEVTLDIAPEAAPNLTAEPSALTAELTAASAPAQPLLTVRSSRTGTTWVASSSAEWLKFSPASGTFDASLSAPISVAIDAGSLQPGTHSATLAFEQDGAYLEVPVTLTVTESASVELSFSGLSFDATANHAPAPQPLTILARNAGSVDWTASSNQPWVALSAANGTAAPASSLDVRVDATGLPTGLHSAIVTVAPAAGGAPRTVEVNLRVGASAAPQAAPAGISLTAQAGEAALQRTVTLTNPTSAELTFTASLAPLSSGAWLSATADSGAIAPGGTLDLALQATPASLAPGLYSALLTIEFSDHTVRVVAISLQVVAAQCDASKLEIAWLRPGNHFSVEVARPAAIELYVADSCGQPVEAGSGLLSFSAPGEPALSLVASPGGFWTTTWWPALPLDSVTLSVKVRTAAGAEGSAQSTGKVTTP